MFQLDQATRGQFARERVEELTRAARPSVLATTVDGRGRRVLVRLSRAGGRESLYRATVARALLSGVGNRAEAREGDEPQCV